jgi:hypothetical protein
MTKKSHVTRHTSHVKRHTSHVTRHTSHVTRHTSHVTCITHCKVLLPLLRRRGVMPRCRGEGGEEIVYQVNVRRHRLPQAFGSGSIDCPGSVVASRHSMHLLAPCRRRRLRLSCPCTPTIAAFSLFVNWQKQNVSDDETNQREGCGCWARAGWSRGKGTDGVGALIESSFKALSQDQL